MLLEGNGEEVKVVQELMRHANISVTPNIYAKRSRKVRKMPRAELLSCARQKRRKPSIEAYRTLTEGIAVVDKVGVPDGI